MPVIAYIGLGSNVGDGKANVRRAADLLREAGSVTGFSSLYVTEPVGFREQEDFINAVVRVETGLHADALMALCRSIEDRMGRTRTVRWGPRTIDLDILLFGNAVMSTPSLVVPHPRMAERKFVLMPLAEIDPLVMHPVLRLTAAELLQKLQDIHTVLRCRTDGKNA